MKLNLLGAEKTILVQLRLELPLGHIGKPSGHFSPGSFKLHPILELLLGIWILYIGQRAFSPLATMNIYRAF
jgi:hypothetical protein